jgi:hypothetical protein
MRMYTQDWSVDAALRALKPNQRKLSKQFASTLTPEVLTTMGIFYESECMRRLATFAQKISRES